MRVIAGSAKGRRLKTAGGRGTRPTADRVKEAIFSMLDSRVDLTGAQVLDLFAGSGALGIEALSRGAAGVTFVEEGRDALRALRTNLAACGFAAQVRVLAMPVTAALRRLTQAGTAFDGVLLDPPYEKGQVAATLAALAAAAIVRPGGWVVVEHHLDEAPVHPAFSDLTPTHRYGKTGVTVLHVPEEPADRAMQRKAVYPGSFDPITNGHLDIVRRALDVFDQVVVAVAYNANKDAALFSPAERVELIRESLADVGDRIIADSFEGLLVDYCDRVGGTVVIRGLRAVSDFETEFQMALMNRHLNSRIETFFMTASEAYFYTASRLVKEVAALGGDVSALVPPGVHARLQAKIKARQR
ncbi:MAG: pantetheine-phosphate adenylyltransferase [Deltaproteobacteria bacterium]|nr:pantetheine-phosphate adenylyltransferase [Deltaproteobacteria bacterium]MBI3386753.1 pantetheine-phosphate adenylyltransferase [Deltaproteobacteria bacterium]